MKSVSLALWAASLLVGACGSEDEHGEHEFASRAECEEHYEAEGHTAEEIDELCADVEDNPAGNG